MSKEDWDYYFECSKNVINQCLKKKFTDFYLLKPYYRAHQWTVQIFINTLDLCVLYQETCSAALTVKHLQNFKAIHEFNLYEAKLKYPDEF